jgi:integrase/recombinase XerD
MPDSALPVQELEIVLPSEPQGREATPLGSTPPAVLYIKDARTEKRFWEFFTAQIPNDHTRRAYFHAACQFSSWCARYGIDDLANVEPIHVAAWVKESGTVHSRPTVKQHLAAIRMLFDWLVTGQVLPVNPAHAVRGPKHAVKRGKTPVLASEEMRDLLESIPTGTLLGRGGRAVLGTMADTFARIGAVLNLIVEDN